MGYMLILLSALGSVGKGMAGKKSSHFVHSLPDVLMTNAVRMVLCTVIAIAVVCLTEGVSALNVGAGTILSALLYAVSLAGGVSFWILCVQFCSYVHLDIFDSMEVVISMAMCAAFLNEGASLLQVFGTILLLTANFLMFLEKKGDGKPLTLKSILMLCGSMIATGMMDFAQKLFVHIGDGTSSAVYNFYAFVFTALFLLGTFCLAQKKGKEKCSPPVVRKVFPYTAIMAVCMFINAYTKVVAGTLLDAATLIPVYKGTETILSVLAAAYVLKEKPTRTTLISVTIAFAAIVIINL